MARRWLITGVSSGIGRAVAEAAISAGDDVAGTVRRKADALAFRELGARAHPIELDVTDEDRVAPAVGEGIRALGGTVDVLFNNAGHGLVGAVEETSLAEARAIFAANFFGALAVTNAVLPTMRAARRGHVIAASAVGGFTGFAGLGVYSAAKAAVDIMNEALAEELASFGIQVTILTLGIFRTRFASDSLRHVEGVIPAYADTPAGKFRRFIGGLPGKQPNDPAKAARAVLEIAGAKAAPLHLPLGADAVHVVRTKLARVGAEVDRVEALAKSTGFDA